MHEEQMEAEEQRREEEKRKDADLETRRVVVKDNINNNCFNGDVDEAVKSSIMKTIDSMDEKRLSILEKTSNNLSVNWKDEEGTSHYTYGSGNITMYNEKYGEKRSAEDSTTTFWHEYGHFVDDRASNSGYGYVYTDSRGNSFTIQGIGNEAGEAYYKAAKDDINNFLETTGLSDKYTCIQNDDKGIPWLIDKDGNYIDPRQMSFDQQNDLNNALKDWMNDQSGYTEAVNYLYSMGYPRDPQYSDYMEMYVTPKRQEVKFRERYKGAQEDFYKESQRVGEAQEEFKKTHDYEALLKEQSRLIEEAERIEGKLGWVTDTFDGGASGAFTSVIRGGHTADYYLTNNNGRGEAVANVFSAIMTQDPDIVAGMESLCPNTYKVLSEVILK